MVFFLSKDSLYKKNSLSKKKEKEEISKPIGLTAALILYTYLIIKMRVLSASLARNLSKD